MSGIKGVARVGDPSSKFINCSQDYALGGSPTYFINSKAAHRKTDLWTYHLCPAPPASPNTTFESYLLAGSTYYKINGLDIGRVGDPIFRSRKISGPMRYTLAIATVKEGSGNFFVGGAGDGVTTPSYARAGTARAGSYIFNPTA